MKGGLALGDIPVRMGAGGREFPSISVEIGACGNHRKLVTEWPSVIPAETGIEALCGCDDPVDSPLRRNDAREQRAIGSGSMC
jgi:hypothetical protein